MKENAPSYQPIPHEQLLQARQADLAAYLIARGEQLKPSGAGRYRHAEHDSLCLADKNLVVLQMNIPDMDICHGA